MIDLKERAKKVEFKLDIADEESAKQSRIEAILTFAQQVRSESIEECAKVAMSEPIKVLNESNQEWELEGGETKKRIAQAIRRLK